MTDNTKNGNGHKNGKNGKPTKIVKVDFNIWKIALTVLTFLFMAPLFLSVFKDKLDQNKIELSQALADIKEQKIEKVVVEENKLLLTYKDGTNKVTSKENSISFPELMDRSGINLADVKYDTNDQSLLKAFADLVSVVLPIGLMAVLLYYFLRAQNKGASDIFSFGRSKAKLFAKGKQDVKFEDVAGIDEAKRELTEIVDFLKNPAKYKKIGARTPKGVLLVGPSGTGKCITGESMVWTNKGLMEIKDIPRYYYVDKNNNRTYGASLAGFDLDKIKNKNSFASHWYDLGIQKTIKIRSSQGYNLEGTPEHPVISMTNDGVLKYKKLSEVEKGDYLAIQYGRNIFGDLNMVDQDTAYLMGLLTGDGNMSISSRVGITSIDPEIVKFFRTYVNKRYPDSAITPNGQSYLISNWEFKKYLYQLGMSYLLSFDKVVPPTILQSPKNIQVAFLQGLFDTDASIEKRHGAFEYATVSEKMAKQVQMMMLNLGIIASLNQKGKVEDGHYRPVYRITMTGSGLTAFAKEVGFKLTRKKELLSKNVSKMGRVNTNIDVIPGVGRLIEESWRELSNKKLSTEKLSRTIDKVRKRNRISRQTLSDYLIYSKSVSDNVLHYEFIYSLLKSNLFFSEVVEKTNSENRVYDFTVPKTHSFISNGFISHNTLLARALAGEAGVPFFSMAGSEFMEVLVGVGASRVRDLFSQAKASAPSIIFIDEIDAIGRQRGGRNFMGGHDEREQTLNQILVELDGFTPNDQVLVLASTNRGDVLDPALLRPGRFDRRVMLDMPDKEGRGEILKIHARGKKFSDSVNWGRIADRTVGFSGADLENMLNEAAIAAARHDKEAIEMNDIEEAATKVKLGPARKRLQSKEDRTITAAHEAGHAIVTHFLPKMDPVHRISIVARGMSLGHTLIPPAADRSHETRERFIQQLAAMLGGRAAEEVVFNEMTSGASNDIELATRLVRAMVEEYGMSSLGPINWGLQSSYGDFGNVNYTESSNISQKMQEKVDLEVAKLMETAHQKALTLVKKNRKLLDKVTAALLEKETIDRDEFEKIVGKKK